MKIVVDSAIPFIHGVFEPFAEVVYKKGVEIVSDIVKDADALVIRTRTKCNALLLDGSSVKLIATATIGEDHIDKNYCAEHNITVKNAAGCNAGGVVQYVFTALYDMAAKKGFILPPFNNNEHPDNLLCKKVLGVVGVGNVGSRVADFALKLGFKVLLNDPEKMQQMLLDKGVYDNGYVELDYLLKHSDIVTMHTSLNPTSRGLASGNFFKKMKQGAIFINASRGEVTDEQALYENKDKLQGIVTDVWNNEPAISETTMQISDYHTPHIAGYSLEGKVNGTVMSIHNVANFFNIGPLKLYKADYSNFALPKEINFGEILKMKNEFTAQDVIRRELLESYNINIDSANLKENISDFESLRNNYNYRREFVSIW